MHIKFFLPKSLYKKSDPLHTCLLLNLSAVSFVPSDRAFPVMLRHTGVSVAASLPCQTLMTVHIVTDDNR